ncbi:MAG TPA: hypothetical protein VEK76_11365 [Candidatus Binatia bacterium]|nr:hypothetical protein [Candidatus Binatia bacterium]
MTSGWPLFSAIGTAAQVLLLVVLATLSGFAVMGPVAAPLRLEERLAMGVVCAFTLDAVTCFLLSLWLGLGPASILLAPVLVTLIALALSRWLHVGVVGGWVSSWRSARASVPTAVAMAAVTAVAAACFILLFSRAMYDDAAGNLVTGYWMPDWAQHLITASSFSVSQNLPPQDPILSGTPLYYPFLPDFTSAMLMRLGLAAGPALWAPQALLGVVLAVLVVSLAARLGARRSVGVLAVVICFLGGGLGFVGALHDACLDARNQPQQCSAGYVISNPVQGLEITGGTLRAIPGLLTDQPTSYDGMATAPGFTTPVFANQQWYTPLFAWWLPQRTLLEGFDVVLAVLVLLAAALGGFGRQRASPGRPGIAWWDVAVAGLLAGLLPVIHVQSLFALAIVCAGLAALSWRRIWLVFGLVAFVVAAPRTAQLLGAPHGSVVLGNRYPWFEPGWMSKALGGTALPATLTPGNVLVGLADVLRVPFTGTFWQFWWENLGVAVPVSLLVVLLLPIRGLGSWMEHAAADTAAPAGAAAMRAGRAINRLTRSAAAAVPPPLLRFFLACLPVFALSNIVVFQSWDWDNTKLLLYWYLGFALLISAVAVWLWVGVWRRVLAVLLVGSVIATGCLAVLRMLPSTAPPGASPQLYVTGPYVLASAADRTLAADLEAGTASNAVFLTPGSSSSWQDPIAMLTGRRVVMGWTGWLWSYGLDYEQRQLDVTTAYQAATVCASSGLDQCQPVLAILQRYQVGYVEVDGTVAAADARWWSQQGLPITASAPGIVVYGVGAFTSGR